MKLVCQPESVTHLHLLSVLVTELSKRKIIDGRVRILDAGCGNGHFSCFLQLNLTALFPKLDFEIYGYDIADHGVQAQDFFQRTLFWCCKYCPGVKWEDRLKLITHDQNWPFESDFFDYVLSNQVVEHVWDHRHFFLENARVLRQGGIGAHLFPLKHYIYEGHLLIPFVHRIKDWYLLKSYIAFLSRLGFGAYKRHNNLSINEYSERHADYMTFFTNYLSYSDAISIVKQAKLRPSLKYTVDFYWHKLRQLCRQSLIVDLGEHRRSGALYSLANHSLKYVSCITLFVEKDNSYVNAESPVVTS